MGERPEPVPSFVNTCGNPSCRRPIHVMVIHGRQDILCGRCGTVTEFEIECGEQHEEDEE